MPHCFPHTHLSTMCPSCRPLQRDLTKRMGNLVGGAEDVKKHPWFTGLDWAALAARALPAPHVPVVHGADDASNFDDYSDLEPLQHDFKLTRAQQGEFVDF